MQLVLNVTFVKLANVFECNVFIFENKRQTAYEVNIAK